MSENLPPQNRTKLKGTGIVYIAEDYQPRFTALWESEVGGRLVFIEAGPGWENIDDAIAWGEARTSELRIVSADTEKKVPRRSVNDSPFDAESETVSVVSSTRLDDIPPETRAELLGTGVVYVAEEDRSGHKRFFGHWESEIDGKHVFVEQGPGWDDPEEAIAWGRSRAPKVLVRMGVTFESTRHYSAGEDGPETISKLETDPEILRWPPTKE
jgi:hypothetical protein